MRTNLSQPTPSRRTRLKLLAIAGLAFHAAFGVWAENYQDRVLASHPVGYWPLNLGVDTQIDSRNGSYIAADLSGHNNFGDYVNISPKNGQSAAGPSKYLSNAVVFNGVDTYVDLGVGDNTALLDVVGPITMEAWVQATIPQESGQYGLILSKGYDLAQEVDDIDLHIISTDSSHTAYYYWGGIYTSYEGLNQQSAQGAPVTTDWQHVVATWEQVNGRDGIWSLYVDGVLAVTNAAVGPALYAPPYEQGFPFVDPWAIGNGTADGGSGRLFSGNLCHVALYTNALSADEVLAHYNLGMYGVATLAPPALSVTRATAGTISLSWEGQGYVLQSTPSLSNPSWTDVTGGTVSPATLSVDQSSRYFRLRK